MARAIAVLDIRAPSAKSAWRACVRYHVQVDPDICEWGRDGDACEMRSGFMAMTAFLALSDARLQMVCNDTKSGDGTCVCANGFTGAACSTCPPGHFGTGTYQSCPSRSRGAVLGERRNSDGLPLGTGECSCFWGLLDRNATRAMKMVVGGSIPPAEHVQRACRRCLLWQWSMQLHHCGMRVR